jgi:multisubunit Na+/H+ antiporter MnhE subunit
MSLAVPGTDNEIIALIVKNDISFKSPQKYWITNVIERFITIAPGTAVDDINSTPPLKVAAADAAALLT